MKVLVLNPYIPEYRIPIFNLLGEKVDLTIGHSGELIVGYTLRFKQVFFRLIRIGPFFLYRNFYYKRFNDFDIIISEGNLRYLDRNLLIINPIRKYKWINWGIGVSASYKKGYDKDRKYDFLRQLIFKKADAQVFYSDYPIIKYLAMGFKKESLFVAHNTVQVNYNKNANYNKKHLLFIGTLYKEKKVFELLEAYLDYLERSNEKVPLVLIGEGSEKAKIAAWVKFNNLDSYIDLVGSLYDESSLEKYFREAYLCISPGQAGLSVLKSMGYGVPFVTRNSAVTGGEIFNIIDQENGFLYSRKSELVSILTNLEHNKELYIEMGKRARDYYLKERNPEIMIDSLFETCKYVMAK